MGGALLALVGIVLLACTPYEPEQGEVQGPGRAARVVARLDEAHRPSPPATAGKQILFGDLHVHSTYSVDAFLYSLPIFGGEGAHPPADACDFARWCAGLDFFAITDHAEGLTRSLWEKTKDTIRQCNARAGDPNHPDLVAFMGFEWTQMGRTPETHFGHKNVIFRGLGDDELPARPISAVPAGSQPHPPGLVLQGAARLLGLFGMGPYGDLVSYLGAMATTPDCDPDTDTRELPLDCRENAETPAVLFRKLDEWGFPALVIPHGLAWGIHAPPGSSLDTQLTRLQHDPARQRLLEISSGHGNSEEFRDLPDFVTDESGQRICAEPTADFLPCCWQAGEIVRSRCADPGSASCEEQVRRARRRALAAGSRPETAVADTSAADWLDCGQCRDCFKPAMHLRPRETAQYGAAIANFAEPEADGSPLRFRFGFISSTDNHAARPATGYKQYARRIMTDARGIPDRASEERIRRWTAREPKEEPEADAPLNRLRELFDEERVASFMYPGGTVAVHAAGRDRKSIWQALMRREVYGTSGPRILLWFDLLNAPRGRVPMGSQVSLDGVPRFEVRAVGAWKQRPGCPDSSLEALGRSRLHALCLDQCYWPGDERRRIAAIEVVRIRSQAHPGEPVAPLIEDPWRRFECPPDPAGCRITFEDPDYPALGRDVVYYVRALQEPTPAINGANLRTRFDASGRAVAVAPCSAGWRTPADDDCLAPVQERAWSSPIYVDRPRPGVPERPSAGREQEHARPAPGWRAGVG